MQMKNQLLRQFLLRWAANTLGVLVATQIVPGIEVSSGPGLLVASLVLGLLNAFVRPLLTWLSLPLVILSLGLFLWVINALLLSMVAWLVKPFVVASFWSALGGSAVISIVSWLAGSMLGLNRAELKHRAPPQVPPSGRPPAGRGPVIDV
jgi:putative membrane protein